MTGSSQYYSDTLEKGLRILTLFDRDKQELTLSEISRAIGINKTSVYRYVNTYCDLGYLRRDPRTKMIKLGPQALTLAHTFIKGSDVFDVIRPVVDEFHEQYQLHIDVAMIHGDSVFLVYRREARETLTFRSFTTTKGLHYLATGKAAMAFLPEDERVRWVERLDLVKKTEKTITDKQELLTELELTFKRGYSFNNEEFVPGLLAIGAPILNCHTSRVEGAVSFDTSTAVHSMESFEEKYAGVIKELADRISSALPDL